MLARIYQPTRSAMQSGQGKTDIWILEYAPEAAHSIDPLMGWISSNDMNSQVQLTFQTKEDALSYAKSKNIPYYLQNTQKRKHNVRAQGYAGNFSTNRKEVWTH